MRKLASPLSVTFLACVVGGLGCETAEKSMVEADFCTEYAKRECAAVAPPCVASAAACEPVRVAHCQTRVAALKNVAYTTRSYRPANVNACLDKVKETYGRPSITGAALKELEAVCNRVFQGSSKMLEACQVDFDCEGNLICDPAKLLCGQKRTVPAGGQCANIGEICSPGEYCKRLGTAYVCAKRPVKGAACGAEEPCLESLLCATGTCVDKAASGDVCIQHDDCAPGYCSPFSSKCGSALVFAEGADACRLFLGGSAAAPDAGAGADGP